MNKSLSISHQSFLSDNNTAFFIPPNIIKKLFKMEKPVDPLALYFYYASNHNSSKITLTNISKELKIGKNRIKAAFETLQKLGLIKNNYLTIYKVKRG